MIDSNAAYQAILSHDARFDGVFFTAVTSTGIYCRPICPAKTPKQENCRFFDNREAAEKDGFRPCLRCRPELAPGLAPVDSTRRIAHLIAHRLEAGLINDAGLEEIAKQCGLSSRQLRRIVQKEFGASPIELIQIRRLLLAKQLLTETSLPIIDIAFASGFSSLRRFNDVFNKHYRMPPSHLRKKIRTREEADKISHTVTLQLTYRPPYDWDSILAFLSARSIKGVEHVMDGTYARTVCIGEHKGWIAVRHAPQKSAFLLTLTHSLTPVLPIVLDRIRNLFDLNARPDLIAAHLAKDARLKDVVNQHPGLRVPGSFDGFEMSMRAILGQQITVKAATTLACRFAEAFGEPFATDFPELNRLSPEAGRIAACSVDDIAKQGIISMRAKSMITLAQEISSGALSLEAGMNPELTLKKLVALPGIGPWTAHYIAMRALRWPDAFVKEDIIIRKNLGAVTAKEAENLSQAWRPWRSYAVLYIWKYLG